MKNLSKHRFIAAFLVVILSVSTIVPVSAVPFPAGFADTESSSQWDSRFQNALSAATAAILQPCCIAFGIPLDSAPQVVMWHLFDTAVTGSGVGEVSLDRLNDICSVYNGYFNRPVRQSLFGIKDVANNFASTAFCICMGFSSKLEFAVETKPGSGLLRIREKTTGIWVVDSKGQYPYCEGSTGVATSGGNQWIGERSCSTAAVNMKNFDALNMICSKIKESGTACQIRALSTNYKAIWYNRQYYCDPEGRPFVCYANEGQAAINQDRPDTSVKDEDGKPATDETGTVINNPDNSTNIDLSGMTITLPNGDVQVADAVIYDESTKTYNIDSHDTTNYNITYNYSWTYHINYTSITYIGQTEQYDKKYEVYYKLPDGRDSADLTAEDLEQLNFDIDVVNYGRYADNASIRCLYHFDGDTHDSSYWNYKTDFKWNTGASLTYMDAGAFNGALYLDENIHDFTMDLPTVLGTGDFWLSFRYYQSATLAPVTDSYVSIGSYEALRLDGKNLYNYSRDKLATYSTGTWNEISVVRASGCLFYYLNGVCIGSDVLNASMNGALRFYFGNQQQTYKYFDEVRLLNVASFYGKTTYTCPSVPYDTNLSLVLPDSRVTPIADEYYAWSDSPSLFLKYDFCQTDLSSFAQVNSTTKLFSFSNSSYSPSITGTAIQAGNALSQLPCYYYQVSQNSVYRWYLYYYDDSPTNIKTFGIQYTYYPNGDISDVSVVCPDSQFQYSYNSFAMAVTFQKSIVLVRSDICSVLTGGTPSVFQKHSSVTGVSGPLTNLKVPTLAVKSDIDVTDQQIGGPRPSVPKKGLVWAMVEDGVISSIQIYDGSAWVACDGRIFTGTRWVPYGSYNIVTLKDFYDVADASGSDFSYIYTETSFWNWWEKSWNAFTSKLFAALSSAGMDVSGGTNPDGTSKSLWQRIKDAFNDTLGALIETLFNLIKEVLKALISLATDMLQFFFGFLTDSVMAAVKSFFGAFSDNSLFDFFKQPPVVGPDGTETDGGYGLPSEVGTAFTFISSVVMVLPPDLRSILFFGIAAMVLLAVFKMVKA